MPRRRRNAVRALAGLALVALTGTSAWAVTGYIRNAEGETLEGITICYHQASINLDQMCVTSNVDGSFEVPDSSALTLRVKATGYYAQILPAAGHHEIVLERSPTLTVRLVDAATGEPIESGEVFIVYPSARQKGPFPVNRAGVRIARILELGEVQLLATAEGYTLDKPQRVELERGKQTEVTLKLTKK